MKSHKESMLNWRGLHPGMVPIYRSDKEHASWRKGHKKGLRRFRRRQEKTIIENDKEFG